MKARVHGPLEVKSTPLTPDPKAAGLGAMQMLFHKTFHGDLAATSIVAMIGLLDQATGSGGYVALERLTGTLAGKSGSFCLQHSCTMTRGQPLQSITVIPDSGTGMLSGITGAMTIDIASGQHSYSFEYELAASGFVA